MATQVFDWIRHHANRAPDTIALTDIYSDRNWSYAELSQRIDQLAGSLQQTFGIERGDRVGVLAQNSSDIFEIQFTCARLGAVFLPLNWRLTRPEQAYILENAAARILVCDDDHVTIGHQLSETVPGCEICNHADIAAATDDTEGRVNRNPHVDLTTPVLLVYTSGTTGQPKGAVLTQEADRKSVV